VLPIDTIINCTAGQWDDIWYSDWMLFLSQWHYIFKDRPISILQCH